MIPDTRKDPRAKVLSMTVRYKSATIDEFIEHHSHDVSRGGMFIKTPSPFPPGTLLKFEVRIAEEQKVMQGVGRVVWKREASSAAVESPSGMGVKFIKLDDDSRAMIDRLVGKRGAVEGAFDAGERTSAGGSEAPTPAGGTPAVEKPIPMRKGTMIGLGAIKPADASPKASAPAFFPDSEPAVLPAPEDRTVMRQAAELLRDALREAGGSMDEIGGAVSPGGAAEAPQAKPEHAVAKISEPAPERRPEPVVAKVPEKKPEVLAARPVSARPAAQVRTDPPRNSIPLPKPAASSGSKSAVWMLLGVVVLGGGIFLATQGSKPPAEPATEPSAAAPPTPAAALPPAPVEIATPAPEPSASAAPSAAAPVETPAEKAAREKAEAEAAKLADVVAKQAEADSKKAEADAKKAADLLAKKAAADAKKTESDAKKAADAETRNAARTAAAARAAAVMKSAPASPAAPGSPAAPAPEKPAAAAPAEKPASPAPKAAAPKAPPAVKPSESDNPY